MSKHFDGAVGKSGKAFGKATGDRGKQAEGGFDRGKAGAKDTADQAKAEGAFGSAGDKIRDVFEK